MIVRLKRRVVVDDRAERDVFGGGVTQGDFAIEVGVATNTYIVLRHASVNVVDRAHRAGRRQFRCEGVTGGDIVFDHVVFIGSGRASRHVEILRVNVVHREQAIGEEELADGLARAEIAVKLCAAFVEKTVIFAGRKIQANKAVDTDVARQSCDV